MTFCGILENMIADVLLAFIVIIISWVWIRITYRRSLQLFFGVSQTKRLVIYLSNIQVLRFGSFGREGKKLSYNGEAIDNGEMQIASQIRNLFSFPIPKLTEVSKTIGKLLLSDITVDVMVSPKHESDLEAKAPYIALGSLAYNSGSSYIEHIGKGAVRFQFGVMRESDFQPGTGINPIAESATDTRNFDLESVYPITHNIGGTITVLGESENFRYTIPPSGIPSPHDPISADESGSNKQSAIIVDGLPPITDTNYGIIERILDSKSERVLYYVAGLSEFSTKGAGYYLATQWKEMNKKFKSNQPFLIILSIVPSDYTKCSIIAEKKLPN
jgi:hypothetical protein